jgi:hypothetical protein
MAEEEWEDYSAAKKLEFAVSTGDWVEQPLRRFSVAKTPFAKVKVPVVSLVLL